MVLGFWSYSLYIHELTTSSWNYLFNAAVAFLYIAAFVIALQQRRKPKTRKSSRKILVYFGLAALSWGVATLIWTYYNLILSVSVPYPSIADLFFLLAYPLLGMALWYLHESYDSVISRRIAKESVYIVLTSAIIIFAFLNRPDLSPDLGLAKNLLNIAYSLGDVMLVAIALIELRSGQARKQQGLYLLVGFLLLQAAGDFIFAFRNNSGQYWNGDIADVLFGFSALIFALALAQNNLLRKNNRKH